jgi:hypothetical protein
MIAGKPRYLGLRLTEVSLRKTAAQGRIYGEVELSPMIADKPRYLDLRLTEVSLRKTAAQGRICGDYSAAGGVCQRKWNRSQGLPKVLVSVMLRSAEASRLDAPRPFAGVSAPHKSRARPAQGDSSDG